MGNRAVITFDEKLNKDSVGIYLHWNGGVESVLAFLKVCKDRKFRNPQENDSYAMARLVGVIHEFMGITESTSLGVNTLKNLDTDNCDNGTYIVGGDWEIVKRVYTAKTEKQVEDLHKDDKQRFESMCEKIQSHIEKLK